jgi:curli biogenesis system outer membrane secretion channel CsgG
MLAFPIFGAEPLYKIAVLPFDDGSIKDRWWKNNWDVGKGISDELVTELLKTGKFRLIEREQIAKVLNEQNFGAGGRVDANSAAKIGKVLGVQYLVMGRVTEFSFKSTEVGGISLTKGIGLGLKNTKANVAIDARLVNTSSAEIISSVTGKGDKSSSNIKVAYKWDAIALGSDEFRQTDLGIATRDAVASVAKQLAEKTYGSGSAQPSKLSGTVAYAGNGKVIINIGLESGIKPGMIFIVQHVLEVVKDPNTGEVIDEVTEPIAEIKATDVKEKSTTCAVSTKLNTSYEIKVGDKAEQKQ